MKRKCFILFQICACDDDQRLKHKWRMFNYMVICRSHRSYYKTALRSDCAKAPVHRCSTV